MFSCVFQVEGELPEAARIIRGTLDVWERMLGAGRANALASVSALGLVLSAQGEIARAVRIHQKTLEVQRPVLGAEHPDLGRAYSDLAEVAESGRLRLG